MMITNLILEGQVHSLFSENNVITPLSCLLPSIMKQFQLKKFFACIKLNCLKQGLI